MPKMKMKVKVYFYHLFMLAIVMLLCFYLVYRDMKRIENNVLGIFNRVGTLEKMNNETSIKVNQIIERNNVVSQQLPLQEGYIEEGYEDININNENSKMEEVNNIMRNVINLNENVLNNQNEAEPRVEEAGEEEEVVVEAEEEVVVEAEEEVEADINPKDEQGVLDLLDSIENNEDVEDLSGLDEETLLGKTNLELKNFLKSRNLPNTGSKKKLVNAILHNNN